MASSSCEAHRYMVDMTTEIKQIVNSLSKDQQDQREMLIRLSENLLELKRFTDSVNETLKEMKVYNATQDSRIEENTKFSIKISSVLGFLVVLLPVIMYLVAKLT